MQIIFLDKCQLGGANKSRGDHCSTAAPQNTSTIELFKKQKSLNMKSTFPGARRTSCLSKIKVKSNVSEISVRVKKNRDPEN